VAVEDLEGSEEDLGEVMEEVEGGRGEALEGLKSRIVRSEEPVRIYMGLDLRGLGERGGSTYWPPLAEKVRQWTGPPWPVRRAVRRLGKIMACLM
jgi:hypothetical protein